ncbi:hypothetical protein [Acidocella sp.]|uniref:hypothetical protein n=1 Tax=Acidocella sp. TaxID=50710 RepID=UPI00262BD193|nr:hypothetical protein [Acidocella sp.]
MEEIRLVIWDLDGVYWPGVLAEGTAQTDASAAEIVRALNRRGIINAICSKNEHEPVWAVLAGQGMAGAFVFADIGFGAKGARVAEIIEAAQLRPACVLLIDDEPANLAEAERVVPGLNVAGPELVAHLLANPRLRGRADEGLTRLAQYKLLEGRRVARGGARGEDAAFLRESGICVRLVSDVEAHLPRAVELINRTNQLNFTKRRLPEVDAEAALRAELAGFDMFAGLIEVRDRYGDYGLAGFFAGVGGFGAARLVHFCFSCRLLDMGVERWLYERLGRPEITVAGTVAAMLDGPAVDWIMEQNPAGALGQGRAVIDRLVLRGGCDLSAMSHYLRAMAEEMAVEFNTIRAGRQMRRDHAAYLPLCLTPPEGAARAALEEIGLRAEDWHSALAAPRLARETWVLSFWSDSYVQLYEREGVALPFLLEGDPHATIDVTTLREDEAAPFLAAPENMAAWRALCAGWRCVGTLGKDRLRRLLAPLLARRPRLVMFMLAPEVWRNHPEQPLSHFPAARALNDVLREAAALEGVEVIDMFEFAPPDWAGPDTAHFDRATYARAAARIAGVIGRYFGDSLAL